MEIKKTRTYIVLSNEVLQLKIGTEKLYDLILSSNSETNKRFKCFICVALELLYAKDKLTLSHEGMVTYYAAIKKSGDPKRKKAKRIRVNFGLSNEIQLFLEQLLAVGNKQNKFSFYVETALWHFASLVNYPLKEQNQCSIQNKEKQEMNENKRLIEPQQNNELLEDHCFKAEQEQLETKNNTINLDDRQITTATRIKRKIKF